MESLPGHSPSQLVEGSSHSGAFGSGHSEAFDSAHSGGFGSCEFGHGAALPNCFSPGVYSQDLTPLYLKLCLLLMVCTLLFVDLFSVSLGGPLSLTI